MKRVRSEIVDSKRKQLYKKAIFIAIAGNLLLVIIKGIMALTIESSAIFSDAANSLSDTFYSLLMGLGLYVSQRPADETHPQGHSQFEPLVSLFISLVMVGAGIAALWQSIELFQGEMRTIELGWPTFVLSGAILIKVIMYIIVKGIGVKAKSPAIYASARDNLVDVLSSSAALVGIWGSHFVHPFFDPVAGLIVALWIFYASEEIIWENLGYLTGRGAPKELTDKIAEVAGAVEGVDNVHHLIAEYVGPQLRIDMHINLAGDLTLNQAHDIGEIVSEKIESLAEVDLVFIHIEPNEMEVEL